MQQNILKCRLMQHLMTGCLGHLFHAVESFFNYLFCCVFYCGGHIVFGADPIGVEVRVGVRVASLVGAHF